MSFYNANNKSDIVDSCKPCKPMDRAYPNL